MHYDKPLEGFYLTTYRNRTGKNEDTLKDFEPCADGRSIFVLCISLTEI